MSRREVVRSPQLLTCRRCREQSTCVPCVLLFCKSTFASIGFCVQSGVRHTHSQSPFVAMERLVGEMLGGPATSTSGVGLSAERSGASAREGDDGDPASADEFFAFLQQYTAMGGSLDPDQAPPELAPVLRSLAEGAGGAAALREMLVAGGEPGPPGAFEHASGTTGGTHRVGSGGTAPESVDDREEIFPEPGFVVKTSDDTGRKVFINVCGHFKIQAPGTEWVNGKVPEAIETALANLDDPDSVQQLRFPVSVSPPRNELDKKNRPCTVYDAVFNGDVVKQAICTRRLKVFLVELVLQWIGQKYGANLDQQYKLPHRRYVGDVDRPASQCIRIDKKSMIEEIREPDEEPSFPLRPRRSERQVREENERREAERLSRANASKNANAAELRDKKISGGEATRSTLGASLSLLPRDVAPPASSAAASAASPLPFSFDGLPEISHRLSFRNRPVTSVVLEVDVPDEVDLANVKIRVVSEGATVDVPGRKPARVAFPFAVDGDEAACAVSYGGGSGSTEKTARRVTFEAPYVAYDALVRKHRRLFGEAAAAAATDQTLSNLSGGFLDV